MLRFFEPLSSNLSRFEGTEFAFGSHTTCDRQNVPLIREWKDILGQVSDSQTLLSSLKDSRYFGPFKDRCEKFEEKFGPMEEGDEEPVLEMGLLGGEPPWQRTMTMRGEALELDLSGLNILISNKQGRQRVDIRVKTQTCTPLLPRPKPGAYSLLKDGDRLVLVQDTGGYILTTAKSK